MSRRATSPGCTSGCSARTQFFRLWLTQVVVGHRRLARLPRHRRPRRRASATGSPAAAVGVVMAARIVPGFFLGAGVRRDRRPLRPQAGHGRVRHRPGRRCWSTLPFVDTVLGPRRSRRWCSSASRCCGRRPRRRRSPTSCRPTTSPRPTRCRWSPPTAPCRSPRASSRSSPKVAEWHRRDRRPRRAPDQPGGPRVLRRRGHVPVLGADDLPPPAPEDRARARDQDGRRIDFGQAFHELKEGWRSSSSTRSCGPSTSGLATGLIGGGMLVPLGPVFSDRSSTPARPASASSSSPSAAASPIGVVLLSVFQRHIPKAEVFAGRCSSPAPR